MEVITESDGSRMYMAGKDGEDVFVQSYPVFSGIELIYNNVHIEKCGIFEYRDKNHKNIFEINHCREGRLEYSAKGEYAYLSPGDISIHKRMDEQNECYFPSSHYHGVSVRIDVDEAPKCLSCFLNDVNVEPKLLMDKFCAGDKVFVARSNAHLEHIFSELYSIPEEVKKGYFKIKVLEILLFLSCMKPEAGSQRKKYSASQVALAKEAGQYLMQHMDEKITIDSLAEIFHVSSTQMKNCFKGVYGVSVYNFIRTQKMQSAAVMLKNSDKTILEIANMYGYDNGSKFASAFRATIGQTPNEYRQVSLEI